MFLAERVYGIPHLHVIEIPCPVSRYLNSAAATFYIPTFSDCVELA